MGLDCRHCRHRAGCIPCDCWLEQQQQYCEQHLTEHNEPVEHNRQRIAAHGPADHHRLRFDLAATDDSGIADIAAVAAEVRRPVANRRCDSKNASRREVRRVAFIEECRY
jgi:hypothetical protein